MFKKVLYNINGIELGEDAHHINHLDFIFPSVCEYSSSIRY